VQRGRQEREIRQPQQKRAGASTGPFSALLMTNTARSPHLFTIGVPRVFRSGKDPIGSITSFLSFSSSSSPWCVLL
jgi:hypothetical protein